jgi:hypothetical protein
MELAEQVSTLKLTILSRKKRDALVEDTLVEDRKKV